MSAPRKRPPTPAEAAALYRQWREVLARDPDGDEVREVARAWQEAEAAVQPHGPDWAELRRLLGEIDRVLAVTPAPSQVVVAP